MRTGIISLLAFSMLHISWKNTNENSIKEQPELIAQKGQTLELNNGKKWKVDDSMMIHIRNMEKDVKEFSGTELSEYKSLSGRLQSNISLLTS